MQRQGWKTEFYQTWHCRAEDHLMQRRCKARATTRRENKVLPDLALPSRSPPYAKVAQGECNDKEGKQSFTGLGIAEPKTTLCKGGARREQRQGGKTKFYRTWHCRAEDHLMQRRCKARATTRRENKVLPDLALPSRSPPYAKVAQGECNDKEGKQSFTGLGIAEPKPTLCKDTK